MLSDFFSSLNTVVLERCQIVCPFKRAKLCKSIASLTTQTEFSVGRLTIDGFNGTFQFHSQGLDQDYDNHCGTVTAVFQFPKKTHTNKGNVLNCQGCKFKLSVIVYGGRISENKIIGQSSEIRNLTEEDQQHGILHMTVHDVVRLQDIIFTNIDKILIEVTVELIAKDTMAHD